MLYNSYFKTQKGKAGVKMNFTLGESGSFGSISYKKKLEVLLTRNPNSSFNKNCMKTVDDLSYDQKVCINAAYHKDQDIADNYFDLKDRLYKEMLDVHYKKEVKD